MIICFVLINKSAYVGNVKVSYHIVSYNLILRHITLYCIKLHYSILCYFVSYYVISHYSISYHIILYYIILYYIIHHLGKDALFIQAIGSFLNSVSVLFQVDFSQLFASPTSSFSCTDRKQQASNLTTSQLS